MMAMYWHAGTTDIPTLLTSSPPTYGGGCGSPSSPLRGQAADVAGAHLAPRRARGARQRFRDPRRRPPEGGWLRLPALLAADVSAGEPGFAAVFAPRSSPSTPAGRPGAGGREEADLPFLVPTWLSPWASSASPCRGGRRDLPDAVPTGWCRRTVLCVGVVYDRAHTRRSRPTAGAWSRTALCRRVRSLHAGQRRAAWRQVHRRVPHAGGRVQANT